jgi:hypothetical protein
MESQLRRVPKEPKESPFTIFLWEREKFDRRATVLKELNSNPIFAKGEVVYSSIARKDVWTRTALQSRELIRLKLRNGWSNIQFMEAIRLTDNFLPVQPQFRIFMSNLERQMTDEQKEIWIPKAERFQIFGSYAQTELGHGSNVRGIETTATFDRDTDEFIINSPTLSSTKYWIGATGMTEHSTLIISTLRPSRCLGYSLYCCRKAHSRRGESWQPLVPYTDPGSRDTKTHAWGRDIRTWAEGFPRDAGDRQWSNAVPPREDPKITDARPKCTTSP